MAAYQTMSRKKASTMIEENKPSGARRWLLTAAAAVGACALVAAGTTMAPAATRATLPKFYVDQSAAKSIAAGASGQAVVNCKVGDHTTGGGFTTGSQTSPLYVETSEPFGASNNPDGWNVVVFNNGTSSVNLHAFVDCEHV